MPNIDRARVVAIAALLSALAAVTWSAQEKEKVTIVIETEAGAIEVELDAKRAPGTVVNFLRYVDGGHYNGGRFHRTVKLNPDNQPQNTVKIEVIQAGPRVDESVPADQRKEIFPPIALERTNKTGILHKDGVISMARLGPDTATGDFFICVGDQPELDFGGKRNPDGQGFAAFGRVVRGMDVVRKIHQSPVEGQRLTPPVRIVRVTRK